MQNGYIAVTDGRIAAIGGGPLPPVRRTVYDFRGKWVLPGVVDGQVHCGTAIGWPGMPGMSRAAITGGTTTGVDMPYDNVALIADADIFRRKIEMIEESAYMDIALFATIKKKGGVDAIPALVDAGACAFKMSTRENSPTRFPRITHPDLYDAFRLIAQAGVPVHIHNEDEELVTHQLSKLLAEGKTGLEWHEPSRPPLAELVADAVVFEIGACAGARVHLVHSSLARGFEPANDA
jgi:allantoinase